MCIHFWLETTHTRVCNKCGLETQLLKLSEWDKHSAPLMRNYDRPRRFENKIDKLLGIHAGPAHTDPIWKYLENERNLSSPADVREAIRRSTLRAKHYDCVKIFSDVFTPFRMIINDVHSLKQKLCAQFNVVHQRWAFSGETSFFSYDFLIRLFLEELESPLVVYLKAPTNRRRHMMYIRKLTTLSQNGSKMCCQKTAESHSRSVLKPSSTPQNPQRLDEDRGGLSVGHPRNRNADRLERLVLSRRGNCGKSKGGKQTSAGASSPEQTGNRNVLHDLRGGDAHTCGLGHET